MDRSIKIPPRLYERIRIEHNGHTSGFSLLQDGHRKTWPLTGWENEEGGAGVNPATAYAPAGSGISRQEGAPTGISALNAQIVNPAGASQVVNPNGNPLVVYHGTGKNVPAFDSRTRGSAILRANRADPQNQTCP